MSKLKDEHARKSGSAIVLSLATGQSLLNLDDGTRQIICYMMAKETISLTKCPAIIELESMHQL